MILAKRFYIAGRVQGVYFRASTRHEAERLGLRGWANNLLDGRVEVLAVGDEAAVAELGQWLHRGPPRAQVVSVDEVAVEVADVSGVTDFRCG
jgi:acylphosphatase